MPLSLVLDILLVLLLLGYVAYGYQNGFVRGISSITGVILGAIAALIAIPFINSLIPDQGWRIAAAISTALLLVLGGQAIGASIGYAIRRRVKGQRLRTADRVLGAVAGGVVSALAVSLIAFSVSAIGIPFVSPAISSSSVLRTIDSLTPDPAKAAMARLRGLVAQEGLPLIVEALGGSPRTTAVPDFDVNTAQLGEAARSVVRITGNAYACGQSQSGSGFVIEGDRVVTNAHVVAGVEDPVVEVPGGPALPGRVVYFDPQDDLAVIHVPGLEAAPLELGPTLPVGSAAVTAGYPFGGPFQARSAHVMAVNRVAVADIYGDNPEARDVYQLAARVQQGDSGGPLLSETGEVVGVVFAKAANNEDIGYAMTMEEFLPVAESDAAMTDPVSSGSCVRGG